MKIVTLATLALVVSLGAGEQRSTSRLRNGGAPPAQASGVAQWTSYGSATWLGAPTPTIDCVAQAGLTYQPNGTLTDIVPGGAYGAGMVCTGAGATAVTSATTVGTYAVGTSPQGVAFDGTNIWVTNYSSNNVTKLLASTGALVGTYAVGTNPFGVAFDGTNIWVVNIGSNNVTKLLASTGELVGTYAVGSSPYGVAFDGTNIWVANIGNNNVTKLSAYMSTVGSPYYPSGFAGPQQMAVALNGTTDYFSIGDVTTGHTANDLNVCVKFTVYGGSVPGVIGNGDWTIYIDGGGNVILYVNMSTPSSLASGAVTIGASNIVCFSYHYVADGTSILRGQLNNLAPVTLTTAHGPIPQTANVVKLGWDSVNDTKLNGSISEAWFTVNQPAMSAAQIAVAITDQMSLLTTKPVAGPETYTGPGGFCTPVSDAQGFWMPTSVPCVKSSGINLRGPASNLILQSQTIATGTAFTSPWAQANNISAPTTNADQAVAPDGTTTADEVDIPAVSGAGKFAVVYQGFTATAAPYTFSCWAKAVSGTPTTYLMLTHGGTYYSAACSPTTSAATRCSVTGTATAGTWYPQIGVDLRDGTQSAQSASAIDWWGCQVEASSTPGRYQATLGTPFSGPADALSVPQVAGALYDSINGGAWSLISANPIVLPVPGSYTGLKQCRNAKCKP